MASWRAKDAAGSSEVLQLLEEYCNKRSKKELSKKFMLCCVKGAFSDEPSTHDDVDNRMFSRMSPQTNMDDIIQRLVELIKAQGDDIDKKIKQNTDLQIKDLDYNMFKKLTSSMQNLVNEMDQAEASEVQIQRHKIALAFEVTSRLSALNLVHQRRVLSFGAQYIQETHSAWIEQHSGWAEAFSID